MQPVVALTYRVLGFSAQALEDREGLSAVFQQLIGAARRRGSGRGGGRLGQGLVQAIEQWDLAIDPR
jgi:hypothetical protein